MLFRGRLKEFMENLSKESNLEELRSTSVAGVSKVWKNVAPQKSSLCAIKVTTGAAGSHHPLGMAISGIFRMASAEMLLLDENRQSLFSRFPAKTSCPWNPWMRVLQLPFLVAYPWFTHGQKINSGNGIFGARTGI